MTCDLQAIRERVEARRPIHGVRQMIGDVNDLLAEVDRLREDRANLIGLLPRVNELGSEVDRLRAAIEQHQWGYAAATHEERREKNRRLWAVLDVVRPVEEP